VSDYRAESLRVYVGTTCCKIATAAKIAVKYRDRVPTVDSLMQTFGMSRATAYRWRSAFISAGVRDE
jgi:hypothetical protein